jgi:hypothetical protein
MNVANFSRGVKGNRTMNLGLMAMTICQSIASELDEAVREDAVQSDTLDLYAQVRKTLSKVTKEIRSQLNGGREISISAHRYELAVAMVKELRMFIMEDRRLFAEVEKQEAIAVAAIRFAEAVGADLQLAQRVFAQAHDHLEAQKNREAAASFGLAADLAVFAKATWYVNTVEKRLKQSQRFYPKVKISAALREYKYACEALGGQFDAKLNWMGCKSKTDLPLVIKHARKAIRAVRKAERASVPGSNFHDKEDVNVRRIIFHKIPPIYGTLELRPSELSELSIRPMSGTVGSGMICA